MGKGPIFGITSAHSFFEKARQDYARVEGDIADPAAAMSCILSLYHLHEWVWSKWLKQRPNVQSELGISRKKSEFVTWLDAKCPNFALLQELANGAKHCRQVHSSQRVAGFGIGPYGVGPYGAPYLLIDLGDFLSPDERYLVASDVLKDIMNFWTSFFTQHEINGNTDGEPE